MSRPPAWAEALLRTQLDPCDGDPVVGDLREEYCGRAGTVGAPRALFWYLRQTLSFALLDARSFARVSTVWLLAFMVAASASFWGGTFNPVPGIAASLLAVPSTAFHSAFITARLWASVVASLAVMVVGYLLSAATLVALHLPHPPFAFGWMPVYSIASAIVSAAFGKAVSPSYRVLRTTSNAAAPNSA